jgi:hypothetical protein
MLDERLIELSNAIAKLYASPSLRDAYLNHFLSLAQKESKLLKDTPETVSKVSKSFIIIEYS